MTRADIAPACVANINALVYGYTEEVEYKVKEGKRTVTKSDERNFPSLLQQLRDQAADPYASKKGGPTNNPNKSKSRPPVNQAMLDLVDTIDEQAERMVVWLRNRVVVVDPPRRKQYRATESKLREIGVMAHSEMLADAEVAQVLRTTSEWVSRARVMLGHEERRVMLANVVCDECGGALSVAADASTDVECVGTPEYEPCGNSYARSDWLRLLRESA